MTFDPAKHISADSPVTRGPIVIDDHGRILSGHDRHDELLDRTPEEEARYKLILINHSPQFGVDPMAIMRMKTPVLVRKIEARNMPHD